MNQYFRLVILIFSLIPFLSCKEEGEKTKVKQGRFIESVYASVQVQPEDHYLVYASKPALIEKVYVEEGDTVYEGHVLATLASDNQERSMRTALLDLELAEEKFKGDASTLSNIQAEISAVSKELEIDSINYFRQKELWEEGIGAKIEIENKKLKYDLSLNRYNSLVKRYEQSRLELETNYQRSINRLQTAQSNLNDYTIRALMDGMVYDVNKKVGEFISNQEPFAFVGKANAFVLEMLVDEVDIPRVELDQKCLIALDAYGDDVYEAKISKVYPSKDNKSQAFKVEAMFLEPPATLYPGMSGEANIIIEVKEDAIFIPREYLSGNTVITDDGPVEVEIGLMNMYDVEILSGLDTTQWVFKPTP